MKYALITGAVPPALHYTARVHLRSHCVSLSVCVFMHAGASSGIGEATAKLLAREGYSLFLTGRNEANLKRVADACRAIHQEEPYGDSRPPLHVHESSGDVADEADCERLMRECLSHSQTIHAAILNAGIGRGTGALVDTTARELDEVLRTNVRGVYLFLVRLMPVMRRQGHGQIVVTSSVKGIRAGPTGGIYCASKYAVEGLVASARCELKGSGVKIGTVNPAGTHKQGREMEGEG